MFSGQGSQYYQMGRELYERHAVYIRWMQRMDRIVRDITDISILDHLYSESQKISVPFDQIRITHPALFMVEYALSNVLMESGLDPDYVLGASLGEYTAAVTSGGVAHEEMLSFLIRQVEILESRCPRGGMIAIVDTPEMFHTTSWLYNNSEQAADNYPCHFVVSGEMDGLKTIKKHLIDENITHQILPVPYGFHSSSIDPAAGEFLSYVKSWHHRAPRTPFFSCAAAEEIRSFTSGHWWDVARKPVEFRKTIQNLERRHASIFIDIGPSGTLANFVKYNLAEDSESEIFHLLSPFGRDMRNLEKVLSHFPKPHTRQLARNGSKGYPSMRKDQKMLTWVFPGQGSQKKGMGGSLFDEYAPLTEKADAILGYSIKKLCIEDPAQQLNQTQFTQPALYVVNALSWLKKREMDGRDPDYLAGHSLGEYNALLAAGGVDFETGLKLVKKRGELMSRASGGAMAAVLNATEEKILELMNFSGLSKVDIANYNAPSQIVISGQAGDIERSLKIFRDAGITCIPLPVSGAFHSRHMHDARRAFKEFLKDFEFSELTIPLISNVIARPYEQAEILPNLADQITHSVRWSESIRYLMGRGHMDFEEIGPGRVLTNLIKKIRKEGNPIREPETFKNTARRSGPDPDPVLKPVIMSPESLGNSMFKKDYGLRYAYVAGGMTRGIASKELVVRLGHAGMMGYLGTGGMDFDQIEKDIQSIQKELYGGQAYGVNLLSDISDSQWEAHLVDICLRHKVHHVEASAYLQITPPLVRYRLNGLHRDEAGNIVGPNRVMAKVSRPEVAEQFLHPAPQEIVTFLLDQQMISEQEAALAKRIPMADDLCIESDSGGHTNQGIMAVLLPTMIRLRDKASEKNDFSRKVRVGAAGGIGIPESAASAFLLGADFILTGSINQCTIEAGTSGAVKDILQQINVQDTAYAPSADMFEMGARVQVVRKGVFYPSRANKLYDIYRYFDSWDEIDSETQRQIEDRFFKCGFKQAYAQARTYYSEKRADAVEKADGNTKQKLALVFRWHLDRSMQWALDGNPDRKVDYQIYCGPAMGAFNQWVKGTDLEDWKNRHVDRIAERLLVGTAEYLNHTIRRFIDN